MKQVLNVFICICFLVSGLFCNRFFIEKADATELPKLFSAQSFEVIKELKGKTNKEEIKNITKKEFFELIDNPQSLTAVTRGGRYFGLINSRHKILITFDIKDIKNLENFKTMEIKYYQLPKILSKHIKLAYISSFLNSLLIDRIIIMDNEAKILITLDWDGNGENLTIINAFRFNKKCSLSDLQVICGYIDNGLLKTVYCQKDKIYTVENDTMKLLQTRSYNWRTISGYSKPTGSNGKIDRVYLYQVNKNNILRKYDFINNKIIYECNLNCTPIKGEILKIVNDLNLLYILTDFKDRSGIYLTNEERFNIFEYTDIFEDGSPFGKIVDMNYFSEGREDGFALLQMNKCYPIEFISSIGGIWREIQLEEKRTDERGSIDENILITKVITDIAKWNHPTKEVFKKYGFRVTKIEFTHNNTYPIFYVKDNPYCDMGDDIFLEELANKNGYWDFKIITIKKFYTKSYEVTCDKKKKMVSWKKMIIGP